MSGSVDEIALLPKQVNSGSDIEVSSKNCMFMLVTTPSPELQNKSDALFSLAL